MIRVTTANPPQRKPQRGLTPAARRQAVAFYLTVSPWVIGFVLFTVIPMALSLYLSFTQWNVVKAPVWTGLDNFVYMFTKDPDFYQSLKVTLLFTISSVPLQIIVALALAILLNEATYAVGFFRTAFYIPSIVASVASAVLWTWIFNARFGPINGVLRAIGLYAPNWFSDPRYALPALVIMSAWGVGGQMLIFLAGLKGIPRTLYEAAEVDGAGRWVRFWRITMPMLSPTLFFNLVMGMIGAFQTFDSAYVISTAHSGQIGNPQNSTLFYLLHLYQEGFTYLNMGYASALAWVLFIIILVVTLIINQSSKSWVFYSGDND
ncbi:MAG TPA: sugar ABC transporter permease [Phototrophicaceae bacterium]|nr:sugar ABC transporter permease [Phototrophicaceae bacterium]